MRNVDLTPLKLNAWRKIALGTWNEGGDPSVYGSMDLDATNMLALQKKYTERTGKKAPTITAIVARAVALTLAKYPQINGMVRFGKIYTRKNVSIFIQTAVDDEGKELSGVVIHEAENKSATEIFDELTAKAKKIRSGDDAEFKKAKSNFNILPAFVVGWVLRLISFLMYTLNLDLRAIGLPKDPFGSAMVTSIGMLGLDEAYAPLVPYSRVPILLAVGAIRQRPIVNGDGGLSVAPIYKLCVTVDHRFVDGMYASKMAKAVRFYLETPEGLEKVGL